jgi:nucleoside 2-deoxyribosyltransferase
LTKIYLAHSGEEKERGREIQRTLEKFGYEVQNPFDKHNPYVKDLKWEKGRVVGRLSKESCKWVVETDLRFIDKCDAVVMVYPENSTTIGTPCEMTYAFLIAKKPLIIYTPKKFAHHPWIEHMASRQFMEIEDLLSFMEAMKH